MARTTRERMIDTTAILLAKRGLQGTSFSEVLEASGAPRGSLYHHFPGGKAELVVAAIDRAGERAIDVLDALEGRPAPEVAAAFLGLWRSVLEASRFSAGCAVLAVTVAADSGPVLDRAALIFQTWRGRLAELLATGGVPARRAPAVAATLIAGGEGAVVLARAERDFTPFDEVAHELVALVVSATA